MVTLKVHTEEDIRRKEHPLIYFRQGATGRRPALLGSRLNIADLVTTIRQNDGSVERAAEYLEIPAEQVEAAARYYAEYKDEVDELSERAETAAARSR